MIKRLSQEFQSLIHSFDSKNGTGRIADFTRPEISQAQKPVDLASKPANQQANPGASSFEMVDATRLIKMKSLLG